MTAHPIDRDDRQVLLHGQPAGWIWYSPITRSWVFSADPAGTLYRRYVSYAYSGPLTAYEGLECDDGEVLLSYLEAGGRLAGWTMRRYAHYLLPKRSLERESAPIRVGGAPRDFAAMAERVADTLETPPWR